MKSLKDVPMMPLNDIKKAPITGFETAEKEQTGVYITRWNDVVGVMLTQKQYEDLVERAEKKSKLKKDVSDLENNVC